MVTETLLTTADLAAYLQVPIRTVEAWRSTKTGPRTVPVGRHVRYRREDVDAWLEHRAKQAESA